MSRFITFSRQFPAYHPKAVQPTCFVEKIWNSLPNMIIPYTKLRILNPEQPYRVFDLWETIQDGYMQLGPKHHTIRAGHRWKVGDKFSPRVWSGKPYASKMITIAPDIEIKKVWKFEISNNTLILDGKELSPAQWIELAKNDGLKVGEMLNWFRYPHEFSGQVICWNPNLEY
jgi:hypothetical protein